MTTFVLVPGAGGAAWCWSRVVPLLERAGERAVAVDLPGDDESVDLEGYVRIVQEAVESTRPDRVVLVGQSFGGFSAAAVACRTPVDALVLVNAMVPLPGESGTDWWSAVGQRDARRAAEAAAGRDPDAGFDPLTVFFHDAAPDVVQEAATQDRDQSDAAFSAPWPEAAWPDVPTTVLVADDDRLFPPSLQERVVRERLGLDVILVPGGHLNTLTRPRELTEALLALR